MKQLAKGSQDPQIVKEVYGKSHSVAVMRLTFLIGFLLLASFALGQAGMVQSVASIGESGGLVKVIPFAPVVVCGYPANTSSPPCSNLITTYTTPTKAGTCSSSTQVIWPGTSTCQSTADPSGNFAFFADTGQNATYYFKYLSVWFGPFAVVVGGGGGASLPIATTQGQTLAATGPGNTYVAQTKAAIDARDAGVDCTGATDSTAALNTLFTTISGRQVNFPDVCSIKVTFSGGHGLVIQGQSSFVLHGNGHKVGTGGFVGPVIYGCDAAASGPVLYINRSGYGRIEGIGITARGPSGCSTSTFTGSVQVDSTGNPGVTTHDIIFDNDGFTTSAQGGSTPANYIGLSITDGGKQNGEMIRVKNSWIHCQNSSGSIGIDLENPTSDKDVFESNNIANCFIGVKHANGNATIKDNLFSSLGNFSVFGSNGAAIYIGNCSSGGISILDNEVDSSGDFINSGNDGVGAGCSAGLNIEGNFIGVSDPTPNNYVINIGNCCATGYNLIGNQFLVTSNTSQYLVGSASQGLFGPLGHLYDLNNSLRTPTGSNSLGFTNLNYPFQQGEYHTPLSNTGGTLNVTFGPNGNIPEFSSYSKVLFANPAKNSQAQQSPFLAFRSYTGAAYDDWSFEGFVSGSGSQLSLAHSKGTSTNNWFVAEGKTSGITLGTIATPSAPGVNVIGTGGATTYTYSVVDFGPNGNTLPSPTVSTAVGNATLSSSNYNQLLFGFQFGTTRVCVRREVGGATQGIIGCIPVAAGNQTYSTQDNANQYEFHDTGLTGDGSAAPVLNTTGRILTAITGSSQCLHVDTTGAISGTGSDCSNSPVWSSLNNPIANLSLSMGTNTTAFSFGDYGASPSSGIFSFTDSSVTSTDTSTNAVFDTGASSRHNPFAARIQGTNQFQVCWQAGPQGEIVIGSAVGCAAISQSPFAKFLIETATASHNNVRLYQKSTSATGTMLEMNNATAAGSGFKFWTACTAANTTDTSCSNIISQLDGSGFLTVQSLQIASLTGSTQCLHVDATGLVSGTGVDCGAGGGGTPGGSTLSFQYNNAGAFAGTTPAATQGLFVPLRNNSGAAATAPAEVQIGDCAAPTKITGSATTGTVIYTDVVGCNIVHDRAASGAATLTIPTPTTLNNPAPIFVYTNNSLQTDTLAPTTFQIALGHAAAAATLSVPSNVSCKIQLDPLNASTWDADCHPIATSGGGGGGTTTNPLTVNNSNSGAASGTTFDGSVARTFSTNTIGAPNLGTANTFGAFLQDFSASTIKAPVTAGFTTTAQGNMGYDSTNLNWHVWQNAADRILPPVNGSTTNGNCVKFVVSGSTVSLQDAGASCIPAIGFLWLPFATTGEPQFTSANETVGTANQPLCRSFQTPAATITPGHVTANVNTASSTQTFNIALYDNSLNLVKDSGSISCSTPNAVTAAFSGITLQPNTTYSYCVAITDTVCALAGFAPSTNITNISNKNSTRDFNCGNSLSAGAMPGTCGTVTPTQNKAFLVLLEP